MSVRQNHIIKSCQFEFSMDDPVNAVTLPDDLKNLVVADIMPKLSLAFDDLVGPDEVLSIDKLEIDLGDLQNKTIEKDFRRALNTHLIREIKTYKIQKGVSSLSSLSIEQALFFFLETGALPWNATVQNLKALESEYLKVRSPNRTKMLSILSRKWPQLRFIQQFSTQFQKRILLDLIHLYQTEITEEQANAAINLSILNKTAKEDFSNVIESISKKIVMKPELDESSTDESVSKQPEELYVKHAGMVLVHPFLDRLFSHLDLDLKSNKEDRVRAVHLLYFMATDKSQPEEHECGLLKLLCGLDMNFPIAKELTLSPQEKEECISCLEALIKHWDKLGNTSVDGLRQSFLNRSGKLSLTKQNATLIVEGETIDILLDFMPWTISSIKLPWMQQTLNVDWA